LIFVVQSYQLSRRTVLSKFAALKGENRHDLTAKRKKSLSEKIQKISGAKRPSFYPIVTSRFYKKLASYYLGYSVYKHKFSIVQAYNTPMFVEPLIKASAFKIRRRFLSSSKKVFFKHFKKRKLHSNRILTHNKIWQKRFFRKFQKQFFPYATKIFSKYKRILKRKSHFTGYRQFIVKNKFLFSAAQPALMVFLKRFFIGATFNFCLYLIENRYCIVNGVCITDPWFFIMPYSIINFDCLPTTYIFSFILMARFLKKRFKNTITKIKLKAYSPLAGTEVNFKTGEIFFLDNAAAEGSPFSFLLAKQSMDALVLQWVFQKQRKFGFKG